VKASTPKKNKDETIAQSSHGMIWSVRKTKFTCTIERPKISPQKKKKTPRKDVLIFEFGNGELKSGGRREVT
jgi:hypothetical protein